MEVHNVHETNWISLRRIVDITHPGEGYYYSHESRCNGHIVAVLPFGFAEDLSIRYLLRYDITPCWSDQPQLCVLTGGMDTNDPVLDALRELEEESGYVATADQLIDLGFCMGSKSSDSIYHIFAIDVTGMPKGEAKGDGSYCESHGRTVWVEDVSKGIDAQAAMAALRLEAWFRRQSGVSTPPEQTSQHVD